MCGVGYRPSASASRWITTLLHPRHARRLLLGRLPRHDDEGASLSIGCRPRRAVPLLGRSLLQQLQLHRWLRPRGLCSSDPQPATRSRPREAHSHTGIGDGGRLAPLANRSRIAHSDRVFLLLSARKPIAVAVPHLTLTEETRLQAVC